MEVIIVKGRSEMEFIMKDGRTSGKQLHDKKSDKM